MTRKHFTALAAALRAERPANTLDSTYAQWLYDVRAIAQVCRTFNPNFDFDRFAEAAGF